MSRIFQRRTFFKRKAFMRGIRKQTILTNVCIYFIRQKIVTVSNKFHRNITRLLDYIFRQKQNTGKLSRGTYDFCNIREDGLHRFAGSHKMKQIATLLSSLSLSSYVRAWISRIHNCER